MMKILLIVVLLASGVSGFGQAKKLRWSNDLCEFEGTYNGAKLRAAQLRDTLKLFALNGYPISIDATPTRFEDIKLLNVAALDREYNLKSAALKKLDIVKTPYWEALRRKKLNELEQVYRLSRTTMLAYNDPAIIRKLSFADSCIKRFADPLASGGEPLLRLWREVNEDSRRRNADPERIRKIFESQLSSTDKFNYARVEVMRFGWWNCANEFIEYDQDLARHEKEFKKLFTRVRTIGCEEP